MMVGMPEDGTVRKGLNRRQTVPTAVGVELGVLRALVLARLEVKIFGLVLEAELLHDDGYFLRSR